jgi:hypothetical protein
MFLKSTLKEFLMGFKNHIRHMAAVVGNTLMKTFPELLHHSPGLSQAQWRRFPVGSFSFKSSRDCVPKGKSHMGLNLVTMPATPRLPLTRSNAQGTFPSTLRANVVLCELWPRPVETKHVPYRHRPVWGAERSPTLQRPVGGHSYCCTTFLKKVRADHTKVGNC